MWLIKPAYASKGLGVRLLSGDLVKMLQEKESLRVVQKYIERPLLVGGLKFDIRVWALVTSWAPLTLWLYDECLLRFCSDGYSLDDLSNRFAHITNRTVQRQHSAHNGGDDAAARPQTTSAGRPASRSAAARPASEGQPPVGGGLGRASAGALGRSVERRTIRRPSPRRGARRSVVDDVLPAVRRVVTAALLSAQECAEHRADSFEIYGLDLVLDDGLTPWLIEVNESPNLSSHGSALKAQILAPMLAGAVDIVLAPRFGGFGGGPVASAPEAGAHVGGWLLVHAGGWRRRRRRVTRRPSSASAHARLFTRRRAARTRGAAISGGHGASASAARGGLQRRRWAAWRRAAAGRLGGSRGTSSST